MNEIRKNKTVGFFILAAGRCERFGAPKFLFPYKGIPLLKRILYECLLVNPEYTYIITGAYHRAIASKVDRDRLIYNPDYTLGEKLDLKFTPPVITISNSISIYIHKHTS